ncbi:MAG: sugar ABC transporter permease, partial [Anaerolineae bacterium]|nr:sugar ABC transporter permease [Anaerolineae bacterium]
MSNLRGGAVAEGKQLAGRAASRRKGLSIAGREELAAWVCVLPWIVGFLAFTAGPMLVSLYLSFTETNMLNQFRHVGLQNYADLFSFDQIKSLFWVSLYNTCYYVFLSVPLGLAVGFLIAVLLNQDIVGRGLLRTVYYLPSVIPGIAASLLWIVVFRGES